MYKTFPQRILMTADTVGGVWNYSLILAKALQKYDVEIHLATMGERLTKDQWEEANSLHNLCIYESDYALEWMENPWKDIEDAGDWLLDLAQKINPDIIHLNNYPHVHLPWNAPVITVGHSCVLSWWKAVHQQKPPHKWAKYAAWVTENLQLADLVVSVSQQMLNELQNFYGPFGTAKVIYNAREQDQFQPAKKKQQIFSMGRLWDEAKNIEVLQQIAPNLDWPVYIAGEDNGKFTSENENLHPLGKLSSQQVAEKLGESAIYAMPARYEPFGLSVLEAALSGCALVLGDIPTLRELWEDAALFANPDKSEEVQEQIEKLVSNPTLRKEMAAKALEHSKKFSMQKMGSAYWGTYQELLKNYVPKPKLPLTA